MPPNDKLTEKSSLRNQFLTSLIINIMRLCHGLGDGWMSPMLPILSGSDTPLDLPLTMAQASSIASISCIGGLLATPVYGWISDKYGRKPVLLISAIPFAICWILKLSWETSNGFLAARFLLGVGGAGSYLITGIYTVETALTEARGVLTSFTSLFWCGGILIMYIMGAYMSYYMILYAMIPIPLIFFFLMLRIPETPVFLLRQKKDEEAAKAIAWLRSIPYESTAVRTAISSLKKEIELANTTSSSGTEDVNVKVIFEEAGRRTKIQPWKFLFTSKPTFRAFIVCFALMTALCFAGMFAVITYANEIFQHAGSSMSPNTNAIIVGVLQLIGCVVASSTVEKFGRKILLIGSCGVVSMSMFTLGTYFYLKVEGFDVSNVSWIPVTAASLAVATFAMGFSPIPYLLPSEMIMVQARSFAMSIIISWEWTATFIVAKFYNYAVNFFGIYGVFWGFSAVAFSGVLIAIFFLPETKKKSLESIVAFYSGQKKKHRNIEAVYN